MRSYVIMLISPWRSGAERTATNPRDQPFSYPFDMNPRNRPCSCPFDMSFSVRAQFVEHYLCAYCSLCIVVLCILHSVINAVHVIESDPLGAIFSIAHRHGNIQVIKFKLIQVQWQMCFHFRQCSESTCMCQCPVVTLEVPIL